MIEFTLLSHEDRRFIHVHTGRTTFIVELEGEELEAVRKAVTGSPTPFYDVENMTTDPDEQGGNKSFYTGPDDD